MTRVYLSSAEPVKPAGRAILHMLKHAGSWPEASAGKLRLMTAYEIVARMLGYASWHELNTVTATRPTPSASDEDLALNDLPAFEERRQYQVDAVAAAIRDLLGETDDLSPEEMAPMLVDFAHPSGAARPFRPDFRHPLFGCLLDLHFVLSDVNDGISVWPPTATAWISLYDYLLPTRYDDFLAHLDHFLTDLEKIRNAGAHVVEVHRDSIQFTGFSPKFHALMGAENALFELGPYYVKPFGIVEAYEWSREDMPLYEPEDALPDPGPDSYTLSYEWTSYLTDGGKDETPSVETVFNRMVDFKNRVVAYRDAGVQIGYLFNEPLFFTEDPEVAARFGFERDTD